MQEKQNRFQWFIDRIGKVVYRNNYCDCPICERVYQNGLLITDMGQAIYCYDNECDYCADGHALKYFDTREEMLEFEATLKTKQNGK